MYQKPEIKILVGSHAYGLATKESDFDYKHIFVEPTSSLLKINSAPYYKGAHSSENNQDEIFWEIGHFLSLAIKSNPTVLECFKAPIVWPGNNEVLPNEYYSMSGMSEYYGIEHGQFIIDFRSLFPYVWSSIGVYNAYKGYSHDQHRKMFDEKVELARRKFKYAVAHLRVLIQGIELLQTGTFSVSIKDHYLDLPIPLNMPYFIKEQHETDSWLKVLKIVRDQGATAGQVVDMSEYLKDILKKSYEINPDKVTNLELVNEFLLKVRKDYW